MTASAGGRPPRVAAGERFHRTAPPRNHHDHESCVATVGVATTFAELTTEWFAGALGEATAAQVTAAEVEQVIWGTAIKVMVKLPFGDHAGPAQVCVNGGFDPALAQFGLIAAYERETEPAISTRGIKRGAKWC